MNRVGFLLVFGSVLQSVQCQETPAITHISGKQIKNIGDIVDFECSIQHGQDYPVVWVRFNKDSEHPQPISENSALTIPDSRFSLNVNPSSSTYKLQINDIRKTDAGIYACEVLLSTNSRMTAEAELQVLSPPVISDDTARERVVFEGQALELECYADGFPVPKVTWRRENNARLPTGEPTYEGNKLNISSVRKEDRGTYYCIAENGVGRGARRKVELVVQFAPVVIAPRPRVGQALHQDADFACRVEAYPPAAITWFKDDVQLSNDEHHRISHFDTDNAYTDSILRAVKINKNHYGMYVCKAANKLGLAESRVELWETITPVCPPACDKLR